MSDNTAFAVTVIAIATAVTFVALGGMAINAVTRFLITCKVTQANATLGKRSEATRTADGLIAR